MFRFKTPADVSCVNAGQRHHSLTQLWGSEPAVEWWRHWTILSVDDITIAASRRKWEVIGDTVRHDTTLKPQQNRSHEACSSSRQPLCDDNNLSCSAKPAARSISGCPSIFLPPIGYASRWGHVPMAPIRTGTCPALGFRLPKSSKTVAHQ